MLSDETAHVSRAIKTGTRHLSLKVKDHSFVDGFPSGGTEARNANLRVMGT